MSSRKPRPRVAVLASARCSCGARLRVRLSLRARPLEHFGYDTQAVTDEAWNMVNDWIAAAHMGAGHEVTT